VIVPVFREDPTIFAECLETWIGEHPDELIIVVDVEDHGCRDVLAKADLPSFVQVIPYLHNGKRSALGVGIRAATKEILVLSDSDTAWRPGLLRDIQMPYIDPRVGGVGCKQTVAARDSSIFRRVASWMLNVRCADFLPALGA